MPFGQPIRKAKPHTVKVTVYDENDEVLVSRETSGNPGIAFLLQAAATMLLKELRDIGYDEREVPDTLPEDIEIPDVFREEDWT